MIAQFALRLTLGMSLTWCLMPRSQVSAGFFRIQMLVTLALSVLAALTLGQLLPGSVVGESVVSSRADMIVCVLLAVGSFLGSVAWTLERRRAGTFFVFLICFGSAGVLLLSASSAETLGTSSGLALLLSELSTAMLLGGAMTGMLLGHWYLTVPTMSISPLARLNFIFGIAGLSRLALSGLAVCLAWDQTALDAYWIWLLLRWTAGIFGPLLLAVMVWRILKYKNTQAATGVLFVGVILTFIGELTASLLFWQLHDALTMPL